MKLRSRSSPAFSLVEVTLALGVAGFCLIAVMGLLPVSVQTNRAAVQQTTANGILSAVISDLRTVPKGAWQNSKQFKTVFPNKNGTPNHLYFSNDGSTGTKADQAYGNTVFDVTVTGINLPGAGPKTADLINVKVSWPYAASSPPPEGSVETLVSLDRN